MLAYMQTRAIPGPWAAGERILVSVGSGPLSERLVRTARRQADRTGAQWTAIYVETPAHHRLSKESKEQLTRTLQLAEKLGATTVTLFGLNIASTVIDYARRHNHYQNHHRKNPPPTVAGVCFWIRRGPAHPLQRQHRYLCYQQQ